MKTTIQVNGKPVDIELTDAQVEAIKRASENITDRVKTYADACEVLGIEPIDLNYFAPLPAIDQKHAFASHKLTIIIRALNEGWAPDWSEEDECKYYPWLKFRSGVGFSYDVCGDGHSDTAVGSRLCFKTRELAEYAAKQFQSEYNDYFTI